VGLTGGEMLVVAADRNRVPAEDLILENLSPAAICKYFMAQHLIFQ